MTSAATENKQVRVGWRRKRVLIPLLLLLALVAAFLALRTPDTDRAAMIAKYAPPPSQFVTAPNGLKIHYRDQGVRTGVPVVLLHGFGASLHTWEPLIQRLGNSYRIVTLDLPGHGLTGATPNNVYDSAASIAAVDAVANQLKLDSFVLGGNSMGGGVSWRYALVHPAKVRALLLIDAAGMPPRAGDPQPKSNAGFKLLRNSVGRWLGRQITPRLLVEKSLRGSVVRQDFITDAMVDRYWELLRFPGNRAAMVARASATPEPDLSGRVGDITAPTLILFGKQDPLINASAATTFNERIKESAVVLLEGIGHLPMEEAPDATANSIDNFLGQRLAP